LAQPNFKKFSLRFCAFALIFSFRRSA